MMFLVKTPLGKEVNGAKRWIKLPFGQQLQPAEIAKIAIILFIPALICTMGREIKTLEGIVKVLAWGAFSAAVVFIITENLSTAIIVMGITCIMIFVVHPKTRIFIIIAVGIILIGIVGARDSWYGNGDQRELPSETYSGMAESREICIRRRLPDHAGIVRNWIRRIFGKRSW